MKTTQAWGWLAAGVLALGLNGIYHDGGAAWAHRAVGRVLTASRKGRDQSSRWRPVALTCFSRERRWQ
jgi:hypothetical protein